jgi:hypothetical protein
LTATPPVEHVSRRERARALFDRLPTKWLITGVLAALLALSAVLGGLDDAPATPIPVLEPGDAYTGTQLRISVDRALLIDAFPEQGVTPYEDGNRLLVVSVTVENVWDSTVNIAVDPSDADSVVPVGVDGIDPATAPRAVMVIDDGTKVPAVQPGVPIEFAYVWEVAPDTLAEGDELTIEILDRTLREGFIVSGDVVDTEFVGARVTVTLEDVGAGADVEESDG